MRVTALGGTLPRAKAPGSDGGPAVRAWLIARDVRNAAYADSAAAARRRAKP